YTDGLIEYKSEKGIMYSQNDLKDFLIKNHTMKASELFLTIRENLFNKIGTEKIIDDVTFLIMEIN
ncbi:MAG: SpoIIE family protein phosphatase, partial [Tissierellia bacterium]|nr:SpoIIE family protein phosphatase [Tissierellia bacterium]